MIIVMPNQIKSCVLANQHFKNNVVSNESCVYVEAHYLSKNAEILISSFKKKHLSNQILKFRIRYSPPFWFKGISSQMIVCEEKSEN
ncbi:hypothetical protein T09_3886 [Trichinella sp. T9]|nr:hypothetical protein T09_3886 [Trichinella sp. T9]